MQCMDGLLTELEVLRDMINSYNAHSGLMQPKLTPNQYLGVFMTHSGTEGLKMNGPGSHELGPFHFAYWDGAAHGLRSVAAQGLPIGALIHKLFSK